MADYDDLATFELLVEMCSPFGVEPDSSLDAEDFFRGLLLRYPGPSSKDALGKWLQEVVPQHFIALGERPRWIQGADWQFVGGVPMMFAGQLDLDQEKRQGRIYHDDTALYVFVASKAEPVVVLQQF